jgi:hypothetical protein
MIGHKNIIKFGEYISKHASVKFLGVRLSTLFYALKHFPLKFHVLPPVSVYFVA